MPPAQVFPGAKILRLRASPFAQDDRLSVQLLLHNKTATVSRETVAVFSQSSIGSGGPGYLRNVNKN